MFPLVNAEPLTVILALYPVEAVTAIYIGVPLKTYTGVLVNAVPLELSYFVVSVVFAPCVLVT